MAIPAGNKFKVQVLLDPEAYEALQREIIQRYDTPHRVTESSLANEIIKSHYAILEPHHE
jgi:hypothetical protein